MLKLSLGYNELQDSSSVKSVNCAVSVVVANCYVDSSVVYNSLQDCSSVESVNYAVAVYIAENSCRSGLLSNLSQQSLISFLQLLVGLSSGRIIRLMDLCLASCGLSSQLIVIVAGEYSVVIVEETIACICIVVDGPVNICVSFPTILVECIVERLNSGELQRVCSIAVFRVSLATSSPSSIISA